MPSSRKTPAVTRKKVTASARARISTRKVRKQMSRDLNESYLQPEPDVPVSNDFQTQPQSSSPKSRWPNEGYYLSGGKKMILYDELSMPQWVVGLLLNILHMKDQGTARQALLQVILAMKDAMSLSWTTVRSAWATSMHDLEEGNLGWQDTSQWSLNRISASQISMASISSNSATQAKKICKYFNEGVCSHD